MRTTVVDGRAYECPMYVVRAGDGWQVRVPGTPSHTFSDSGYGGTAGSFAMAIQHRAELMPITDQVRPLALVERATKVHRTGMPGVYLYFKTGRPGRSSEVELHIRVASMPTRSLYLGTQRNWKPRLEAKLAEAAAIRAEMVARVTRPATNPLSRSSGLDGAGPACV